jgi:autotransporter-associated beta strand protein
MPNQPLTNIIMKTTNIMQCISNHLNPLALAGAVLCLATSAQAVDGNFSQQYGPRYYFAPSNWTGGIIANGVGATMTMSAPNSNGPNNGIDGVYINRDLTLANWTPTVSPGWSTVYTSPGKKLTWDTGTAAAATYQPGTGDGYASHNSMDMYLQSNLVYTNFTQRGYQANVLGEGSDLRGTLSGPGKFTLNWHPINWDGLGNVQYKIQGTAPNTYRGGTELNARQKLNSYNDGNIVKDWNRVLLDKNGALGWGDVTMMHPQVAIRITNPGGTCDRIDDTAALYLISGSVGDTRRFTIVPGLVEYSGVDLDTGVNETISALYIDGVPQAAGTYGRTGSTATNQSASLDNFFRSVTGGTVGLGILTVTPVTKLVSADNNTWVTTTTWLPNQAPTASTLVTIDGETVTVDAAGAAAREVRMTSGILDVNTGTSLDTGRFLSVGNGAAVNVLGTGSLTVSGAGIVEILGTGTISVSGTGTLDVGEIATSGLTVASGAAMTVRTSLLVNSGLDLTGSTLTASAASVNLSSGTLTYGNALSVASLTVGGGALNLAGNNLTVTSTLSLSGSLDMTAAALGDLTVNGATVRLEGGTLTVDTAQTPEVLVYDGGAVAGSGSVIPNVRYEVHNQAISTNLADSATTTTALDAMWGVVELNGTNSYEGTTTIRSGVLRAVSGTGLPTNSLLSFNGGVYEGSGSFARTIANSAGNVYWTGNGGFAAYGGKLTVNLSSGATIDWGDVTAGLNGKTLILGSSTADNEVEITNAINLTTGGRTIQVDDNTGSTADFATLSGIISSTSTGGGITKTGAGTLVLSGDNSYTGNTTLSVACVLGLGHNNALGAATSIFNWNNGTVTPWGGSRIIPQNVAYNNNNTVIGSYDLTFSGTLTSNNNRTLYNNLGVGSTLTLGNVNLSNNATARTLTVRGTGNTIISGTIANGSTAILGNLTKDDAGTLTLSGPNTYLGTTNVNNGKLFVNGNQTVATGQVTVSGNATLGGTGTIGGNVTIANTARLAFNLITPAGSHDKLELAATKTMTFSGASVLDITASGTAASGAYTLVTAPGGFGASVVPATVNLPVGWTLVSLAFVGNDLVLDVTVPGGDPYATWAGAGVNAFDADANNDGVDNGMAWVLGATDKDANATSLLPTLDNTNATYFIFTYNRKDDANTDPNTTIKVEYCSDLTGWTTAVHDNSNIIIAPTDNGAIDSVQVKIIRTLAVGNKLFARLNVQKAP